MQQLELVSNVSRVHRKGVISPVILLYLQLGERYALVFRTDEIQCQKFDDTTDDFYELTVDDAKTLMRDLKRTR